MAFKMRGFNPGTGTGMGSAFRKTEEKAYGGTKTWKEGEKSAERHGQDLNKLVAQRGRTVKGSSDYNIIQNKNNQAFGSKKTHGDDTAHRKSETDKKSKVVHKTDDGDKDKIVTTGNKEKQVKKDIKGTKKTVVIYDKDGNV